MVALVLVVVDRLAGSTGFAGSTCCTMRPGRVVMSRWLPSQGHQCHPALWTVAGLIHQNFRVHGAGVSHCGSFWYMPYFIAMSQLLPMVLPWCRHGIEMVLIFPEDPRRILGGSLVDIFT